MRSWKVCIWSATSVNGIKAPYYSDDPTVNGASYLHWLHNYFLQMLQSSAPDSSFQQDGALPCYIHKVRAILNEKIPDLWIKRGGPTNWPARSSDLTPCDFLCGYMSSIVFIGLVSLMLHGWRGELHLQFLKFKQTYYKLSKKALSERVPKVMRLDRADIEHL